MNEIRGSNDLYQSRRSSRLRPRVARLLDSLISCAVNLLLLRKDCKVGCVGWRYGKRRLRRKTIVAICRSASDFDLIRTTPRIDILWANDSSCLRMTWHLCMLDTYTCLLDNGFLSLRRGFLQSSVVEVNIMEHFNHLPVLCSL
ncbi:endoribonuclease YbeY [Striga asiatica]|uniref:Endoribonuclease YbeY n=1 Tax=Striga asiatica TaxID=4170 RepID=A0A5A7PBN1_STRAF|nr:endoribonuclease YbeY [Striga asiatica]